jgi:uncharacterized sulfatase
MNMHRRAFIERAGLAALGGLLGRSAFAQDRPPNILFVLADDLGWSDLSCYGSTFHRSPHIDALAREGMRFTDAYAAAPVCSATRASILTGMYPASVNLTDFIPGHQRPWEDLIVPQQNLSLPLETTSVAECLGTAGYATAHIGKWHLGGEGSQPEDHGFSYQFQGGPSENDKRVGVLTDKALGFMERQRSNPFYLQLSHHTVHIPLEADPDIVAKYEDLADANAPQSNPEYAAMIEMLDDSTARLLSRLDDLGLADNTLVLFMSDNGGLIQWYVGGDPVVTSNDPLRAEKGTLYEGGVRVPMIVRWPGHVEPASECHEPVTTADLLPTFADAAGTAAPRGVDGMDLTPLLEGRSGLDREAIYFHYPHYHHADPGGAIREGEWKLIEWFEDGSLELYNLERDIGETTNLAPIMPGRARRMQRKLAAWRDRVGAKMPTPNPDADPSRSHEWSAYPAPYWK